MSEPAPRSIRPPAALMPFVTERQPQNLGPGYFIHINDATRRAIYLALCLGPYYTFETTLSFRANGRTFSITHTDPMPPKDLDRAVAHLVAPHTNRCWDASFAWMNRVQPTTIPHETLAAEGEAGHMCFLVPHGTAFEWPTLDELAGLALRFHHVVLGHRMTMGSLQLRYARG
jgi:hypothetical protein